MSFAVAGVARLRGIIEEPNSGESGYLKIGNEPNSGESGYPRIKSGQCNSRSPGTLFGLLLAQHNNNYFMRDL